MTAVLPFFLVVVVLALPMADAQEEISGPTNRTEEVAFLDWDAYRITIPTGQKATVLLSAGDDVDFYVFNDAQYDTYTDPSASFFSFTDERENARAYQYATSQSGLIVVVDNDFISSSGASPTDNVTYTIRVNYEDLPPPPEPAEESVIDYLFFKTCFGWIGLIVLLAIVTTLWLHRAPAEHRQNSETLRRVIGGK